MKLIPLKQSKVFLTRLQDARDVSNAGDIELGHHAADKVMEDIVRAADLPILANVYAGVKKWYV